MDWNANALLLWDWDNHAPFGGNYKLSAAAAAAGGGASSGSELVNGSSSKSTISASFDSSPKAGKRPGWDADAKNHGKNRTLLEAGSSPAVAQTHGLEESQIGLKLGKRTYFEDVSAESTAKNPLPSLDSAAAPSALVKKARVSYQSAHSTCCQVEGCNIDLNGAKEYHRKHRVCETHSKFPKVIVAGQERRFCQQCSRFHDLSEFDQKKRSCRRRLSDHNARRRKPRPNIISFNSTTFSPSVYNDKYQMNMLWNKSPFGHMKPVATTTSEASQKFMLAQMRGSWVKSSKESSMYEQLHMPDTQLANGFTALYHDVDKPLPLKGTAAEVLNQGSEASGGASNLDRAPDLRRALSLLSTNSWGSPDPGGHGQTPFIIMDAKHASSAQPTIPVANPSNHWIYGEPVSQQAQPLLFSMHRNGNQTQEFQLQKAPYRDTFFDPTQIY
ncbi:squamosa promoter-binding-like protein 12 [Musa acuminata AAA Group]|uniref:squamosa promoter-binding-like protein 12 n=1 Tax=Musa acuminata AAA Group TaxID=214697 RepID=UPI0031D25624